MGKRIKWEYEVTIVATIDPPFPLKLGVDEDHSKNESPK